MSCDTWDNHKTLKFIAEYKKRPVLWRKIQEGGYSAASKQAAWNEISEIFGENVVVLKKKMDSLRGSRRREKNRMQSSTKTGKIKVVLIHMFYLYDSSRLCLPVDFRSGWRS